MVKLFKFIEERGWKGQIIPISHLTELRDAILGRFEQGLIDEVLFKEKLSFFSFDYPADLPGACSIIIVAVPTPQMRIIYHWQGRRVPVIVPPTYVSYTTRTESVQSIISEWLHFEGYNLAKPQLPLKTLAVCSGLANYGRNNICYVAGMGSFLQLVAVFSDLPCNGDQWREPKALDRCELCNACLRNCPTRAISKERFLLKAELCLTYHNEASSDFPCWINPFWHHCLIGCLRCQTICPENKAVLEWFEDRVEFSEKETALFIHRVPLDRLPEETVTKMKSLEINENYQILCRNLSMIIDHQSC
jgi:epoxyqueuosine reductase